MIQFKKGDRVQAKISKSYGTILDGGNHNNKYLVEFDNGKWVNVPEENLIKLEQRDHFQIQERVENRTTGRTGTIIDIKEQEIPVRQKIILVQWDGGSTTRNPERDLKKRYNMKEQETVTTTRENIIRAYERADERGKETLRELYPETIENAFSNLVKMPETITDFILNPVMIGHDCAPKGMFEHCLLLRRDEGNWKMISHPSNSDFWVLYCEKK